MMKKKHNILFFDTQEKIDDRQKLINLLLKNNCNIILIRDLEDALKKIYIHDFDYYFLNIDYNQSSVLSIIDFIQEIKVHPQIIAISSEIYYTKQIQYRSYKITYLLIKPYEEKEIKAILNPRKKEKKFKEV